MNKSTFQTILISFFGFCIVLGVVSFSFYKAKNSGDNMKEVSIWGSIDEQVFKQYVEKLKTGLNLEVKAKYFRKDRNTLDSELVEAIASGKGPDIVLLPYELIMRYLDKIYTIPFQNYTERNYRDTFVGGTDIFLANNGVLGLPLFIDPLVMYWNKNIFSSAGFAVPPKKWTEIPLLAKKMSKADSNGNILQSVAPLGGYKNIDNAKSLISALIIQAGTMNNPSFNLITRQENGVYKVSFADKAKEDNEIPAVSAMRFYTEYSNPRKSVYSWNNVLPSSKQMFLKGDLAIYFGRASEYLDLKEKNPNLVFDVATLPQVIDSENRVTFGDMHALAILKSSKEIPSAYVAISNLTGANSVSLFLESNSLAPARNDLITLGTSDPAKTIFYDSALISKAWLDPNKAETDKIFSSMIENIMTGRSKLEDAIKRAGMELGNLL